MPTDVVKCGKAHSRYYRFYIFLFVFFLFSNVTGTSAPTESPTEIPTETPTTIVPTVVPTTTAPTMSPSLLPSISPTVIPTTTTPTCSPTILPSQCPTIVPTCLPTEAPTVAPSHSPSIIPTRLPTIVPTVVPTNSPTIIPTIVPTIVPTPKPSPLPTSQPSSGPSRQPSSHPSTSPSRQPTSQPSQQPMMHPSTRPSSQPSMQPSQQPVGRPSSQPTQQPMMHPSARPSSQPSMQPSAQPVMTPSSQPTQQPMMHPSSRPTDQPTMQPSLQPYSRPSSQPTQQPVGRPSSQPSVQPSSQPTQQPMMHPSVHPSNQPSMQPTCQPYSRPSGQPSQQPMMHPSVRPSSQPSMQPSAQPVMTPSSQPTQQPMMHPSSRPTDQPTMQPSLQPYSRPSSQPTQQPVGRPSSQPSVQPSSQPTQQPFSLPSSRPSDQPTMQPSLQPYGRPSGQPSQQPYSHPTSRPSMQPSMQPSAQPVMRPTGQPTQQPYSRPTGRPSSQPSMQPSQQPFSHPTSRPSDQPSSRPSRQPSAQPSMQPSQQPYSRPTSRPSMQPSAHPSRQPSVQPTVQPSSQPIMRPTGQPTTQPSSQPSNQPSRQPSMQPTAQPVMVPTSQPTTQPSRQPSSQPVSAPTGQPTTQPSTAPSAQPSVQPTGRPTQQPSRVPTGQPSAQPVMAPTSQPTAMPSMQPSSQPTRRPSEQPTTQPSSHPSAQPSVQPSGKPSAQPSSVPTEQPTSQPSARPSGQPSVEPSMQPSGQPTSRPSQQPTSQPSSDPSVQPSGRPSMQPSSQPSARPSGQPSLQPSSLPTGQPSSHPSSQPSMQPTSRPSGQPSAQPTGEPSGQPSGLPSSQPSTQPTGMPSGQPSGIPSGQPSVQPSSSPSGQPSEQPSAQPSSQPSSRPTMQPSSQPSGQPSSQPISKPTSQPTCQPSGRPTMQPSRQPSALPSAQPSGSPTTQPSAQPSVSPTGQPSRQPSSRPTDQPTSHPSAQPSAQPSGRPSMQPSDRPTSQPSGQPSGCPTEQPSVQPSSRPSMQPTGHPSTQPSVQPSSSPTGQPSGMPSCQPSSQPTSEPSGQPSVQPSSLPTDQPTGHPSVQPSVQPSSRPTQQPTSQPTMDPSGQPSAHPSMQPTGIPSMQPSLQPFSRPTMQPTTQPTSDPSSQPTSHPSEQPSSQPTRKPTCQPSSQPSSYPTPIPSQLTNATMWMTRLQEEIKNHTVSLDIGYNELLYYELNFHYQAVVGGCSAWNTFLLSSPVTKALTIQDIVGINLTTIKLLYDYYELTDPTPETVGCAIPSIATQIVNRLVGNTQGHLNFTCGAHVWHVNNCYLNSPSICVDCEDPCTIHCSNRRALHYLSSCPDNTRCNDWLGRRNGIIDSINMVAIFTDEKRAVPYFTSYSVVPFRSGVVVSLDLSFEGGAVCAAFEATQAAPVSLDEIRLRGNQSASSGSTNAVTVILINLKASTLYKVYCYSYAAQGNQMSYSDMISTGVRSFTTSCCKYAYITVNNAYVSPRNTLNLITVSLESLPSSDLTLSIVSQHSSVSYSSLLFPSGSVSFSSSSRSSVSSLSFSYNKSVPSGVYTLSATLSGSSAAEYSVVFVNSLSSFTLLSNSSTAVPSPPKLIAATLMTSGLIELQFDSPTDEGSVQSGTFACSNLFTFAGSSASTCWWSSSSTAVVRPYRQLLSSYGSYSGLTAYNSLTESSSSFINIGDSFSVKTKTIKAECISAWFNCTLLGYSSSSVSVTLSLSVNAEAPTVTISAPTFVGRCDDLTVGLTSSYGGGGRLWNYVKVSVSSLQASTSLLSDINTFFANTYVMSPPTAIPSSLLEHDAEYTFAVTMCNFVWLCASSRATVTVLNTTAPYVSIDGDAFRTVTRGDLLSLSSDAFVTRHCSEGAVRGTTLKHVWSVWQDGVELTNLHSYANNPLVFKLKPFSLSSDSIYYVYLTVLDTLSDISAASYVRVYVSAGDLSLIISGVGDSLTMYEGESLTLDALSSSSDSDASTDDAEQLKLYWSFTWNCLQTEPQLSQVCSDVFSHSSLTEGQLQLTALSGLANSTTLLTVQLVDELTNRTATNSVTVSIVSSTASNVLISLSGSPFVSVNEKLKLSSTLTFDDSSSQLLISDSSSAVWSCDTLSLDLSSVALTSTDLSLYSYKVRSVLSFAFPLALSENSLTPGLTYRFTLSTTTSGTQVYSASIIIQTNSPPIAGFFEVSPSSGVELSTLFLCLVSYWEDDELPLTYQFGFIAANGDFQLTTARSERSYDSALLSRVSSSSTTVNVSTRVFDSLDAYSSAIVGVSVATNPQLTGSSELLTSTVESLYEFEGNYNRLRQVLISTATSLNAVDCSLVDLQCSALYNREECSTVSNTCGPCLTSTDSSVVYIGVEGFSNSPCVSVNISTIETSSDSTRRRLRYHLKESHYDGPEGNPVYHNHSCHAASDCPGLLQFCLNGQCAVHNQTCLSSCSLHGMCVYRAHTGAPVLTCGIDDPFCRPVCICSSGYFGAGCELNSTDFANRIQLRSLLLDAFGNQTQSEDLSDENSVLSWISTLTSLSQVPYELQSATVLSSLLSYTHLVLYSASFGLSGPLGSSQVSAVLNPVNSLLQVTALHGNTQFLNSSSSGLVSEYLTSPDVEIRRDLNEMMTSIAELLSADMVLGQSAINVILSDVRIAVKLFDVYPASSEFSESPSLSLPQTNLEVYSYNQKPSYVPLPPVSAVNASTLAASIFSLDSNAFQFGKKITSNVMMMHLSTSTGVAALNCSSSDGTNPCEVDVVLQYNQHIHHIEPYENVTQTICYDRDYFVQNYSCLTAPGTNITVHCPGVPGMSFDRCPVLNTTNMCDSVRYNTSTFANYSSCSLKSFNNFNVTCSCRLDLDSYFSVSDEYINDVQEVANSSYFSSLSVGYVSREKVFTYNYNSTYTNNDRVSEYVISYIVLVTMGTYFMIAGMLSFISLWSDYKHRKISSANRKVDRAAAEREKKEEAEKKLHHETRININVDELEVINNDALDSNAAGTAASIGVVVAFDQETGQTLQSKQKKQKDMPINFREMNLVAIQNALPDIFQNLPFMTHMWRELKTYHRWLTIFLCVSPNYSCFLRVMVLAFQVLPVVFFQSLIYGYVINQDTGECGKLTNQRACLYHASAFFEENMSKCTWATLDHTCHFRQPHQPWYSVVIVAFVSGALAVPAARFVEWQMIKVALPNKDMYGRGPPLSGAAQSNSSAGSSNSGGFWRGMCASLLAWRHSSVAVAPAPSGSGRIGDSSSARFRVSDFNDDEEDIFTSSAKAAGAAVNSGASAAAAGSPPFLHAASNYSISNELFLPPVVTNRVLAEQANHFKCVDQIVSSSSVERDLEVTLSRVFDFAVHLRSSDATRELAQDILNAWGMNSEGSLLRSSLLTPGPSRWSDIEDRLDVLLCRLIAQSRDTAVAELEVAQFSRFTSLEEKMSRLYFLFQCDLLYSDTAKEIVMQKFNRDAFFVGREDNRSFGYLHCGEKQPVSTYRYMLIAVLCLFVLMLGHVLYFAVSQSEQLQKALFFSLIFWIALDMVLVAPMEVYLVQCWLPHWLLPHLEVVREEVEMASVRFKRVLTKEYLDRRHKRKSIAVRAAGTGVVSNAWTGSATTAAEPPTDSSAEFFLSSVRLARALGDAVPDAKFLLSYSNTCLPPGHLFSSCPSGWMRPYNVTLQDILGARASSSGDDNGLVNPTMPLRRLPNVFSSPQLLLPHVYHTLLRWFVMSSPIIKDSLVQLTLILALGGLFLLHWFLYYEVLWLTVFGPAAALIAAVVLWRVYTAMKEPVMRVVVGAQSSLAARNERIRAAREAKAAAKATVNAGDDQPPSVPPAPAVSRSVSLARVASRLTGTNVEAAAHATARARSRRLSVALQQLNDTLDRQRGVDDTAVAAAAVDSGSDSEDEQKEERKDAGGDPAPASAVDKVDGSAGATPKDADSTGKAPEKEVPKAISINGNVINDLELEELL